MQLYNIRGRKVRKNISQYKIQWGEPSRSKLQFAFKQKIRQFWGTHVIYEEFPVYGSRQKVDFINFTVNIAIEVNGEQHDKFVKHFHKNKQGFIGSIKRDREKRQWLEMNGITLVEVYKEDLEDFSEEYIKKIIDE